MADDPWSVLRLGAELEADVSLVPPLRFKAIGERATHCAMLNAPRSSREKFCWSWARRQRFARVFISWCECFAVSHRSGANLVILSSLVAQLESEHRALGRGGRVEQVGVNHHRSRQFLAPGKSTTRAVSFEHVKRSPLDTSLAAGLHSHKFRPVSTQVCVCVCA